MKLSSISLGVQTTIHNLLIGEKKEIKKAKWSCDLITHYIKASSLIRPAKKKKKKKCYIPPPQSVKQKVERLAQYNGCCAEHLWIYCCTTELTSTAYQYSPPLILGTRKKRESAEAKWKYTKTFQSLDTAEQSQVMVYSWWDCTHCSVKPTFGSVSCAPLT